MFYATQTHCTIELRRSPQPCAQPGHAGLEETGLVLLGLVNPLTKH